MIFNKPFQALPIYHPTMTFAQVVPNLSGRGRDLLQVRITKIKIELFFPENVFIFCAFSEIIGL